MREGPLATGGLFYDNYFFGHGRGPIGPLPVDARSFELCCPVPTTAWRSLAHWRLDGRTQTSSTTA
jgi:hypothetical protein